MFVGQDAALAPGEFDSAAAAVLTTKQRNLLMLHLLEQERPAPGAPPPWSDIAATIAGKGEPEPPDPSPHRREVLGAVEELVRPWHGRAVSRQYVRQTIKVAQQKLRGYYTTGHRGPDTKGGRSA
jgi:hypothetical protein